VSHYLYNFATGFCRYKGDVEGLAKIFAPYVLWGEIFDLFADATACRKNLVIVTRMKWESMMDVPCCCCRCTVVMLGSSILIDMNG
jgi:hypothetical protein